MEETHKNKKNRSSGYPVWSLGDCVEAADLVRQNLGDGWAAREAIAKAMGYSSVTGSSGTKVSACVHFGLLNRSGNTYALSELSKSILVPVSEDEKRTALIDAVKSPTLYAKLIATYAGKALPNMLDNILNREYGIINNSSKKAVEIFKKSLEYAGIFHNGVITETTPNIEDVNYTHSNSYGEQVAEEHKTPHEPTSAISTETQVPLIDTAMFTINLSNTGAKLIIPNDFSYDISIGALAEEIRALSDKLKEINRNVEENKYEPEAKM